MNITEHIISITYRVLKNDKRYKYYKALCQNLKLSRKELIVVQNKSIQELIQHAYNSTKYYKSLFDKNGIDPLQIMNADDLKVIPELTKTIINNNLEKLKSNDKYAQTLFKVTSGGSTGVQATIYKSSFYEQMSRSAWLRNNKMVGWRPSFKSAWIWGSPIEHANLSNSFKARLGFFMNQRIIFNAYNYSEKDFPLWHEKILKFKPKVVYGYSSIILEFSKYLIANNIKLPSVEMVVSTTEKLTKREIISKAFNCPVYDQYGCREAVAIGIEEQPGKMVFTDDVAVLNTNEKNEFLLTALHSYGFPLINYKIGDIGDIKNVNKNYEDFPFPKMQLQIGRITDNFLAIGDRKVSTSALSTYLSTLNLTINQHQVIQTGYKSFIINYIPNRNTALQKYKQIMQETLAEYFGLDLELKFNSVEKIPIEKSGKKLMQFKRTFNQEK